jgi:hypothetical protein
MRKSSRLVKMMFPLAFLAFPSSEHVGLLPIIDRPIVIEAQAIPLSEANPALKTNGKLIYEAGWVLTSPSENFGSWSGMAIRDGRITAVNDYGFMTEFDVKDNGFTNAREYPVPNGCGNRWYKHKSDAEAIVVDHASGKAWITLENLNSICRVDLNQQKFERMFKPDAMLGWGKASGPETLVRMPDGSFMIFAELPPGKGAGPTVPILHFKGDPSDQNTLVKQSRFKPPKGFWPVDATALDDGSLLVLVRNFIPPFTFEAKIVKLAPNAIAPGILAEGEVIAEFGGDIISDNFEAITTNRDSQGTTVWILSDNNFIFLQRTLLLKFRLPDGAAPN